MVGRPRKRTVEETLELAMQTFWERGYASTSIKDLSDAIGVGPSSLYNTFGSKEALYARCLEAYVERKSGWLREALDRQPLQAALFAVLERAPTVYTAPGPHGCAVLSACKRPEPHDAAVEWRAHTLGFFRERLEAGQAAGELPSDIDPAAVARLLLATLSGLSQQARDGATLDELQEASKLAQSGLESVLRSTP